MKENKKISIIFILFLGFFIIWSLLFNNMTNIDDFIYNKVALIISENYTHLMKIFSFLGSIYFYMALTIFFLIAFNKRKHGIFFAISFVLPFFLNLILKIFFERSRPDINSLILESGYSYPSGHAMLATTVYGALIYLSLKNINNVFIKRITVIILSLLIAAISFSRVYLGVHYFTDIIGGILIGISTIMLIILIFRKRKWL